MIILNVMDNAEVIPLYYSKTRVKMKVLTAFNYLQGQAYKLTKQHRDMIEVLYLDSGAYSVSRGKVKISVSEYRNYIRRYGHLFDEIFGLDDDFGNPDHNFNNQVYLEKDLPEGVKRPIPVIHDPDDPYGEFESYVEQGHDYIAIGSSPKVNDDAFQKIKQDFPEVKIHVFGKTGLETLMKLKPYSADSANWAHQAGFGFVLYWDPLDEKHYSIYVGEKEKKDKKIIRFNDFHHKAELETFLGEKLGYGYHDLLTNTYAKWVVNIYFFQQLEDYINAH